MEGSVSARVDESVETASQGDAAFDDGDFGKAAELYALSSSILSELLREGVVKDDRSKAFLAEQSDKFKRLARTAQRKAAKAKEKGLEERMLALRGLAPKPKSKEELDESTSALKDRLEKLRGTRGSKSTEGELQKRLEALGPSQFPEKGRVEEDEEAGDVELSMILKAAAESGKVDDDQDEFLDPQVAKLLKEMDQKGLQDDELDALMGQLGLDEVGGGSASDEQIGKIIQQARDYARYSNKSEEREATKTDRRKGSDDVESDSLTSSSSSSSDSDSDDSLAAKKKRDKKKKKNRRRFF